MRLNGPTMPTPVKGIRWQFTSACEYGLAGNETMHGLVSCWITAPATQIVVTGVTAALMSLSASACGRGDLLCETREAAKRLGKAAEKVGQDVGKTVEKAVDDTGKTIEKAVHDTGKTLEKAGQDTGKTLEKAGQDTGKTLEKASHDTGHALEKAGKDVGHFLKQVTNFSLSCQLPASKPTDLKSSYRVSCDSAFSTFKNDLDVCNHAGGASVIAAAAGGGPLTFALAKVAFELCQSACRSKEFMDQCIAKVDASATSSARAADAASSANKVEEERQKTFSCIDDAYTGEKLLAMDRLLESCEVDRACSTKHPLFVSKFIKATNTENANIDRRRAQALVNIRAGKTGSQDYGPWIFGPVLTSIAIGDTKEGSAMACRMRTNRVALRIAFNSAAAIGPLRILWLNNEKTIADSYVHPAPKTRSLQSDFDMTGRDSGKWEVRVVGEGNVQLGSFGFLKRLEE